MFILLEPKILPPEKPHPWDQRDWKSLSENRFLSEAHGRSPNPGTALIASNDFVPCKLLFLEKRPPWPHKELFEDLRGDTITMN